MVDLTPYGQRPPAPELQQLRADAEARYRAEDWPGLLALREQLRGDDECWAALWAPLLAYAVRREGEPGGVDLLSEAVAGGYRSTDMGFDLIESAFATDREWPDLLARLTAPPPAPAVELLDWPSAPGAVPLHLERQPGGRADELVARLPRRRPPGAWDTARRLLRWVSKQWAHASDHVERADALEILDRAERGERFACVEYSIVLTQALNAVAIPARRVNLLRPDHHVGMGKSHVVSEAWIDDLGRWVLLDGQNGAWWVDEREQPLSTLALLARHRAGSPATLVDEGGARDEEARSWWFSHFAAASSTGVTLSPGPFSPVFQERQVRRTPMLVRDPALVEPDLAAVATGVDDVAGPAVRLTPVHPYATGVVVTRDGTVTGLAGPSVLLQLDGKPGDHHLSVATSTPYGVLREAGLSYVTR